jgi:small subunit ribosomal protein S21
MRGTSDHPAARGWSGEGGRGLTRVIVKESETFETALKRFNKQVQADRVLSEIRRRRFFEKPSVIRKRKKAAKVRKSRRQSLKISRQET